MALSVDLLPSDVGDVAATATLVDVFDIDLRELSCESVVEILARMAVVPVRDEVDVISGGRVLDSLDQLTDPSSSTSL